MSNSIWKMPDQKPDMFKPHTIMVVYEAHDEAELILSTQYEAYAADRYINRWCYFDELIAQANKAERAIWWLKEIVKNHRYTPITTAEMALKELENDKKN